MFYVYVCELYVCVCMYVLMNVQLLHVSMYVCIQNECK